MPSSWLYRLRAVPERAENDRDQRLAMTLRVCLASPVALRPVLPSVDICGMVSSDPAADTRTSVADKTGIAYAGGGV